MSTISTLSPEAIKEMGDIYRKYPNAVKGLTAFPGDVGKLAALCLECADVV